MGEHFPDIERQMAQELAPLIDAVNTYCCTRCLTHIADALADMLPWHEVTRNWQDLNAPIVVREPEEP